MLVVHKISNVLQLSLVVTKVHGWFGVIAEILGAAKDVRAKWVDCDECIVISLFVSLLDMANMLDSFVQILHLSTVLLDWCSGIRHAEHFETLGLVGLSIRHLVLLTEDKLLIEELLQRLLLATLLENVLLLLAELLGEDWVVSNVISLWLINLITWHFLLSIFNYVINLKLEPFFESFIENNTISII